MGGIKRCDATLEKVRKFYIDNGYLPDFYNPYNNIEVKDIAPTLTANCDRITNSATVLVFENQPKGSDNLTDLIKRHDADEQADFTQTEAEEWATELAIRMQEGNLDPIPKNKDKQFEQYDFSYVSLFSGIGGFEQALNKFGGTCVLASEIDKFANQAYEVLYGEPTAGDITQIDAKDVPDHDLLVGGFPCQAFSVAGKRLGFEDTRGTLFFEVARIAREKQPKAILLENVKGLVGHDKGKTLDTIVQTLNDIGYTVDFEVLNSKYFGVPQNRERIFIIAVRDDLVEAEPWIIEGNTVVPKGKRRISAYEGIKTFNFDWPAQESVTTRLRDILETDVDEKYYLDDEKTAKLVAQLENKSEGLLIDPSHAKREGKPREYSNVSPTITARDYKEPRMVVRIEAKNPDERMSRQAIETFNESEQPKAHGDIIQAYNRQHLKDGICPTLTTRPEGFKTASLPIVEEVRPVLTPDRLVKRQNGRRFKEDGEESFTLTSQDRHGVALGNPPKFRIRKLTPKECFRLQAFPDEAHDALEAAGISNSQRYKMAGNAVTVSVIEAIGERLVRFL